MLRLTFVLLLLLAALAAPAQDAFTGVARVVAVGDIHGDFPAFQAILRDAGLIDAKSRWSGGKTHLVQIGDMLDRGADSRKVMDLLMALERQAPRAGGRVHVLIGNHEAMNLYGDLRYTSAGEYAAFRTGDSERIREAFWEQASAGLPDPKAPEARRQWEKDHPLGWVEHRFQFGQNGVYGKWLRAKNAAVKIDASVFVHGGISPKYASWSLEQLNTAVRAELKDVTKINMETSPVVEEAGPLWYRGLARESGPEAEALAAQAAAAHGAARIVIGHTPMPGAVLPRLGGRVVAIDVGLSAHYGSGRACLVIEDGKPYALHRGQKIELPAADGEEFIAYLKRVAALEPPSSPLVKYAAEAEAAWRAASAAGSSSRR